MSLQLALVVLALLLALGAVLLLLSVILRRGRTARDLLLATLLIALAIGVWWTSIRNPLAVP